MDNAMARCKDDPHAYELAFSPNINDSLRMAIDYCCDCPVKMSCLLEAIKQDAYGVWGGTTRSTRLELRANGL